MRPNKAGVSYDLTAPRDRAKVRSIIKAERPYLVIGSPPCTEYTQMQQNWNHWRMQPDEVKRRLIQAKLCVDFCAEIYQYQMENGRHFLHERPATASSWSEEDIHKILQSYQVGTTVGHMCQFGMTHTDSDGKVWPVLKPTRWMSSSPELLKRLGRKCERGSGSRYGHKHTILFGKSKTTAAAVYPPELCRQILLGIKDQLHVEAMAKYPSINCISKCDLPVYNLSKDEEN